MKYTVAGVQQEKLLSLGLDIKDASIITYIKDIIATGKLVRKKLDDETYFWINTEKMLEYLPILKIKNSKVIGRRYKIYEEIGLIKKHIHKNPLMGSFTFISPQDKFYDLFEITKVEPTDEELLEEYKKLGLDFNSLEGTQKCPRGEEGETNEIKRNIVNTRGNSKVPSVELKSALGGTQKCPHNNPINNTPINNTKTNIGDDVSVLRPVYVATVLNDNNIDLPDSAIEEFAQYDLEEIKNIIENIGDGVKYPEPYIRQVIKNKGLQIKTKQINDSRKQERIESKELEPVNKEKFIEEFMQGRTLEQLKPHERTIYNSVMEKFKEA